MVNWHLSQSWIPPFPPFIHYLLSIILHIHNYGKYSWKGVMMRLYVSSARQKLSMMVFVPTFRIYWMYIKRWRGEKEEWRVGWKKTSHRYISGGISVFCIYCLYLYLKMAINRFIIHPFHDYIAIIFCPGSMNHSPFWSI